MADSCFASAACSLARPVQGPGQAGWSRSRPGCPGRCRDGGRDRCGGVCDPVEADPRLGRTAPRRAAHRCGARPAFTVKPVGVATAIVTDDQAGLCAGIFGVAVLQHARQGIGTTLTSWLLTLAFDQGVALAHLNPDSEPPRGSTRGSASGRTRGLFFRRLLRPLSDSRETGRGLQSCEATGRRRCAFKQIRQSRRLLRRGFYGGIEETAHRHRVDHRRLIRHRRSAGEAASHGADTPSYWWRATNARLDALASALTAEHGIKVWVQASDLTRPGAIRALAVALKRRRVEVDVLVNNAGVLQQGPFTSISARRHQELIELNVAGVTAMLAQFLPPMCARGRGRVLNVARLPHSSPFRCSPPMQRPKLSCCH